MLIVIIIVFVLVSIIVAIREVVEFHHDSKKAAEITENYKKEYEQKMTEYQEQFGEPDRVNKAFDYSESIADNSELFVDRSSKLSSYIIIYDTPKKVLIKGNLYDYKDIEGYEIVFNDKVISSSVQTSTGSLLGRAAVGGLVGGGVGAIIGASSAEKKINTDSISNVYVTIFTNSIKEPSIVIRLINPDQKTVSDIDGVLRIITKK